MKKEYEKPELIIYDDLNSVTGGLSEPIISGIW
jgi:hypothetical protein